MTSELSQYFQELVTNIHGEFGMRSKNMLLVPNSLKIPIFERGEGFEVRILN